MKPWFLTGIVLLVAVGVSPAADNGDKKPIPPPQYAFGVMEALDFKDGVGTLTILGAPKRQVRPKVMKLAITKDTKFYLGGNYGPNDTPGKLGDPVEAAKVNEVLSTKRFLWILFTVQGDKMTVTLVNFTA